MSCNLDAVNYFCWTHGVDIGPEDLADGCCLLGACEEEDEDRDEIDDPRDDEPPPGPRACRTFQADVEPGSLPPLPMEEEPHGQGR